MLTYKTLREIQPVYLHSMFVTSLPSRSLRSNKGITLSVPRVKMHAGAKACHSLPQLFPSEQAPIICLQPPQLQPSGNISKHISLTWPTPPPFLTCSMPDAVMDLIHQFAVEHWFSCGATEPGYAWDISAIEIWLTDWLIGWSPY